MSPGELTATLVWIVGLVVASAVWHGLANVASAIRLAADALIAILGRMGDRTVYVMLDEKGRPIYGADFGYTPEEKAAQEEK